MKTCPVCRIGKPLSHFSWKVKSKGSRQSVCKPCQVIRHAAYTRKNKDAINARRRGRYTWERGRRGELWRKYRMTLEEFDAMADRQGWRCKICHGSPTRNRWNHTLVVDHDHATGLVRGLLCSKCNTVLGLIGESPAICESMATYLMESKA